jgi:hypothetical protein
MISYVSVIKHNTAEMSLVFTYAAIMVVSCVKSSTVVTEGNSTPAAQNRRKFKHHQSMHSASLII